MAQPGGTGVPHVFIKNGGTGVPPGDGFTDGGLPDLGVNPNDPDDGFDPNGPGPGPPPPPPPPPGDCSVTLEPLPGKPPLRCVGVWPPDTTNTDDTDDTDDWDDLPAVKATGGGAGGTYTWEVVQTGPNAGTIELVSPSFTGAGDPSPTPADDTVRIRGLAPSEQLNDVQIKATWRSADGAQECSDMLELTVIAATLSLRSVGVWSDANDSVRDATRGDPNLGDIRPDIPPGAKGFFQNIEIASTLTPCLDALPSNLLYAQSKQGWAVRRTSTGNNQIQWLVSCDPGGAGDAWCDDCPDADSQDTAVIAPEGCPMFMVDSPGIVTAGGTCGGADAGITNLLCMRFRSWLTADGYRVSSKNVHWWVNREITCDLGAWLRQSDFYGNSFGVGEGMVCALPGAAAPLTTPPEQGRAESTAHDMNDIIQYIIHADHAARARAGMLLLRALESDTLSPEQRSAAIENLVRIAGRTRDQYEFDSAELWAIRARGRLRAAEAIGVLLDRVDEEFPRFVTASTRRPPAASALANIGVPAIGPILERCGEETDERWRLMAGVLRQIDKESIMVRQAMRAVLDARAWFEDVEAAGAAPRPNEEERARRARVRQRLREFLSTPEPDRPKPVISALPTTAVRPLAAAR